MKNLNPKAAEAEPSMFSSALLQNDRLAVWRKCLYYIMFKLFKSYTRPY